ncbi:hypothetical protein AAH991_32290 [Microbispora sp. ZYX-F-249]|uniref:Uncharacterized protein n=1 Tax=Microbispora maris TaxID=3144104 RepID=A0ABV0AX25_9ACTN
MTAHAARAGHPVLVSNSRGPSTRGDAVAAIGPGASAATFEEAAAATWSCSPSRSARSPRSGGGSGTGRAEWWST